ncbi:T9SS type A sorting domain-containing protein, partial [Flavobacterium taihuense]
TTAATYTVLATKTAGSCTNTMTGSAVVSITALPIAYAVTGTAAYCAGGTGVAVGLANSESGVNYQLKNGATDVGSPVSGTGTAISFGNQTTAATYTVLATKTAGSCTNTMTGSAVVSITALPISNVTQTSGVLTAIQTGASYQWYNCSNNSPVGIDSNTFIPTLSGDYKVDITIGACSITSSCITITTLGTIDFTTTKKAILYPNPSKGYININTDYEGNLKVVDNLGRIVKSFNVVPNIINTVNVENLEDGIYYIKGTTFSPLKLIIRK